MRSVPLFALGSLAFSWFGPKAQAARLTLQPSTTLVGVGILSHRLACELSDVINAIAPVAGGLNVGGLLQGVTYYVRVYAYDRRGNVSAPSDTASATPSSTTAEQHFLRPGDSIAFDQGDVSVVVFDRLGRRQAGRSVEPGQTLSWDGRDENGRLVDSGPYVAEIKRSDGTHHFRTLVMMK